MCDMKSDTAARLVALAQKLILENNFDDAAVVLRAAALLDGSRFEQLTNLPEDVLKAFSDWTFSDQYSLPHIPS